MPNALAAALAVRLRDAFPPDRAYPPEAFARPPMPPPVAHYLDCRLRQRLGREAECLTLSTSPWLDARHADVDAAWQQLVGALVAHGHYPQAVWEDALHQAVEHVTAFLVRPAATLAALVFAEGSTAQPASAVMPLLECFNAYPYLHEGVRMYLQQEHRPEIEHAQFETLLRRIDRQVTKDYDADAWLGLLAPLLDLARRADDAEGVPVWLLRAFFRDKDARDIVARLDTAQEQRGLMTLDEDTLRALLDAPPEAPAPPPEAALEPEVPAPEALADPQEAHDEEVPEPEAPPPGSVPLWQRFQRGEPKAAPVAPAAPTPAATDAIPRWKQFRKNSAPAASRAARPQVRTAPAPATAPTAPAEPFLDVSAAERTLFIDELFRGNETAYHDVMRRLEAAPDWAVASQIIAQDAFARHDVDIYSDAALRFTDAVQARFA